MDDKGLTARRAAWRLIQGVTDGHRLLSETLPREMAPLSGPDRARAQRLATESLRWLPRLDRVLGPYLQKRPPPAVHDALRLGCFEICAEGAAGHGVVNAIVTLLGEGRATTRYTGLANAVLRKIAAAPPVWAGLPAPQLPKWLRKPLVDDFGREVIAAIEAVHLLPPPLDLTPRGDGAALAHAMGAELLPTGSLRLAHWAQVTALPGYAEGDWWVQDAAAALPARVLAPQPGEAVLDLCAAPGGKTLQLAAAGADVTALDISAGRMARLAENLARIGLDANTITADALEYAPDAPFDAILLDAPCSATGTIRRHPDLPHAKDGGDFPQLFALQQALIDRALGWLKPGGRLVYCTCSLLIDEGEEQVRDALIRHPGLATAPQALDLPGVDPAWITPEGGLRLRPDYWADRGGMDGFYIASLQKPA